MLGLFVPIVEEIIISFVDLQERLGRAIPAFDGLERFGPWVLVCRIDDFFSSFQEFLAKRLGRTMDLKARAYSDEYIVDLEKSRILSPGPDGQIDTEDDIKLTINPEVLDWVN